MWLPFPERLPLKYTVIFGFVLCTLELIQGTTPYIVACVFFYLIMATLAFNKAGGFSYPTGGYVFFNALLTIVVGLCAKAVLGEPVQTNLHDAQSSITVYLVGMIAMYVAVAVSRRLIPKKGFLENFVTADNVTRVSAGCLVVGFGLPYLGLIAGQSVASILGQLNNFMTLGLLLAVFQRVKQTDGRESASMVAILAAFLGTVFGILSFSKQQMFGPAVGWLLAAAAAGYRTSVKQLGMIAAVGLVMVTILAPYSQYARSHVNDYGGGIKGSIYLLTHPSVNREKGDTGSGPNNRFAEAAPDYRWFDRPMGLLDRLNMFAIDDGLIDLTNQDHVHGMVPILVYFANIVPHVLWADKPVVNFGTIYAHELGMLAADDYSTGISFSPFSDAYHTGKWVGMVVVLPAILCFLFVAVDSTVGSIRKSPWGLIFLLGFSHHAPEGMLSAPVYMATYGVFGVVFAAYAAVYVAPLLGSLVLGPGRARVTDAPRRTAVPRQVNVSAAE